MFYLTISLVLTLAFFWLRRRLGLALLLSFAVSVILSWWSGDLARILLQVGLRYPLNQIKSVLEIAIMLFLFVILAYRSTSSSQSKGKRVFESLLFALVLVLILCPNLAQLVKLDSLSVQINRWLIQSYRYVLTVFVLYVSYDTLKIRD